MIAVVVVLSMLACLGLYLWEFFSGISTQRKADYWKREAKLSREAAASSMAMAAASQSALEKTLQRLEGTLRKYHGGYGGIAPLPKSSDALMDHDARNAVAGVRS